MFNISQIRCVCIVAFLLCISAPLSGQHLQPSFKNYTVDDGLPSSEVYVAIQDNDGYMWFGTDNGLSRFDGYEFKNYGIPEGLTSLVIFDLKLDEEGRLWILSMTGELFIYDNKTIQPYKYNHIIKEHSEDYIYAKNIHIENDTLLICLDLLGILVIDPNGKSKFKYPLTGNPEYSYNYTNDYFMPYFGLNKLINNPEDVQNQFKNNIHYSIKIRSDKFSSTINLPRGTTSHSTSGVSLKNETILLNSAGITAFVRKGKIEWTRSEAKSFNHALYTSNNQIWIATNAKHGIQIYNNIIDIKKNNYSTILKGSSISKIFKDRGEGIWVTSLDNGIYHSGTSNPNYRLDAIGINNNFISGISFSINELYISTRDKAYYKYNLQNNTIKALPISSIISNRANAVAGYDIHYSNDNQLLLGGIGSIIWNKEEWIKLDHTANIDDYIIFKKISSNEYNNKVLVNNSNNITQINLKDRVLVKSITSDNKWITCTNYDWQGNKYIGLEDGLWQWVGDSIVRPPNTPPELLNRIDAIEFDINNNFIIGTKGNGIVLWDRKSAATTITTKSGLTSNIIENIFIDSLQQIWAGTLNGLNRIRLNNGIQVKQFTKKHGLPGNEIVKVRRHKDHIWVATTTGLGRITDQEVNTNTTTPLLNNFTVNGTHTTFSNNHRFSSTENNISIEFVALDYKAQGDINYRYRLQSKSDWQEIKNTSINLPDLRPNNYNIEVQAQNEDGYWSESLLISFSILQPIWKRWWFLLITGISILGISGWYIRKRQSQQLDDLKKEHNIKSQITELERSALQAQMNPHFIFNILNSIQLAINENEKEVASQTLSKFAKLIRATLKNAKASTITVGEEIKYIESYLYLEQMRFKEEALQYHVNCSPELDQFETLIPPMLVQPFVENAIKHGTRNNDKAEIHVSYHLAEGHVIVKVRDNGSGFDNNNNPTHESLGMSITQRRLELLNQEDKLMNTFKIHQLKDDFNNITGTEIEIFIKINQA